MVTTVIAGMFGYVGRNRSVQLVARAIASGRGSISRSRLLLSQPTIDTYR